MWRVRDVRSCILSRQKRRGICISLVNDGVKLEYTTFFPIRFLNIEDFWAQYVFILGSKFCSGLISVSRLWNIFLEQL